MEILDKNKKLNIINLALSSLQNQTYTLNGLKYDCPECKKIGEGEDKTNLEIKIVSGCNRDYYHCWSCGIKGTLYNLIKLYGDKSYLHYFKKEKENIEGEEHKNNLFQFPNYLSNIFSIPEAINYLDKRNIDRKYIKEREIKYCYFGKEKGCLIFPSYENNQLNCYVSHNIQSGEYRTHKNHDLSFTAFYSSFIDKNSPIGLTEGIYDSFSIPNAIPLLGLILNNNLLEWLTDCQVILFVDRVVKQSKRKELYKQLLSVTEKIKIFDELPKPYKDLNEIFIKENSKLKNLLLPYYIDNE